MERFVTKFDTSCPDGAQCAVVDDSIMIKGYPATAGSKMLESFISPIDAQVVTALRNSGVVISGKTTMDEFGAAGIFSKCGTESGAVSAVADGIASFGLCNDYTGAVSIKAALSGLYYIQPTYGTVSRYGLISCVASMDQIGIVCKSPDDGFRALSMVSGYDEKDGVMPPETREGVQSRPDKSCSGSEGKLRVGVPANVSAQGWYTSFASELLGDCEIVDAEPVHSDVYAQVMQILCCGELSNNISRYDGIKFGYRAEGYKDLRELYTMSRTEAFGEDVKFAAIVGAVVLSHGNYEKYYDKAMRIRRLIKDSLKFGSYDVIVAPSPCLARLCGIPAVTVPYKDNAITLVANAGREDILMSVLGNR